MELIDRYYPNLTATQRQQFAALGQLYPEWNARINVISRKDIDNLYLHHILHSLAVNEVLHFSPGTRIMDIGTGGGFPGIPMAILRPDCQFVLVDSIKKKLLVAEEISKAIGLTNVTFRWERAEEEKELFDFVISRAVMPLPDLVKLIRKNIDHRHQQNALPNGLIVLKGGDLQVEIAPFRNTAEITDLSTIYHEDFFQTKQAIYLPL